MYNNFEYSSIFELLESVKEIGIKFKEIYLEINFFLLNDNTNQLESKYKINLKNNL